MAKIWATFVKDPNAVKSYTLNYASPDGTNDGGTGDTGYLQSDTIITSAFTVPTGLTEDSESNTTTTTTVTVSGGTDGQDYDVLNRITTAAGITEDRTIRIQVREQ